MPLAAITDEFSLDLDVALPAMKECGMTGAEIRMIGETNVADLTDSKVETVRDKLHRAGFEIVSVASPLLKCELPGVAIDSRFERDAFAAFHNFDEQPALTARCFAIAQKFGAKIVRVFSFWRAAAPAKSFDAVAGALLHLADEAAGHGLIIGLENEHACNIGTATESARVLAAAPHPNLKLVWDPANCYVAGETPFPDGYRKLPADRIVHVHAKDCRLGPDHQPLWGPLGERDVPWKDQIDALVADGYRGWISLETHWRGDDGNSRLEASRICGRNLRKLVDDRI